MSIAHNILTVKHTNGEGDDDEEDDAIVDERGD
jgi:hypothetical protein